MLKRITIITLFMLLLAACSTSEDIDPAGVEETEQSDDAEEEANEEEIEEDTEIEETDKEEQAEEEAENSTEENGNTSVENTEDEEHQSLVDLTYDIFAAQNSADYDFLQSILSKGSTINKEKNYFKFENVTYPHEQAFLTEEDVGELELRYTHEDEEDGSVIVGFAAIDYENESSFVIDFTYIQEDGSWKMNDMDINK